MNTSIKTGRIEMKEKKKICFAASSGGHFEELKQLKTIMEENDSFCITEFNGNFKHESSIKTYYFQQINRKEKLFLIHFIWVFIKSCFIYLKERPQFIISTGALVTVPFCVVGKIFGTKIIYIESFARVNKASLTGKIMYKFADVFMIQWPELKEIYPRAIYLGGLF